MSDIELKNNSIFTNQASKVNLSVKVQKTTKDRIDSVNKRLEKLGAPAKFDTSKYVEDALGKALNTAESELDGYEQNTSAQSA